MRLYLDLIDEERSYENVLIHLYAYHEAMLDALANRDDVPRDDHEALSEKIHNAQRTIARTLYRRGYDEYGSWAESDEEESDGS